MAMLTASPPAAAHALLTGSSPADGVSLDEPPERVVLELTEPPEPGLSRIDVLDASGTSYAVGPPTRIDEDRLSVDLEGLTEGVYTVSWRVVSVVDGHLTGGAFAFGVGVDPAEIGRAELAEPTTPGTSPLEAAGRTAYYLGLALLVGCAAVGLYVMRDHARVDAALRVGAVLAVVGLVGLAAAQARAAGSSPVALLGSSLGRALAARALMVVVIVGAVLWRQRSPRSALYVVALASLGAVVAHVMAGHAAAGSLRAAKIVVQVVHFEAVAVWLGGLAVMLVSLRGLDDKTVHVRRFSSIAGIALAVVAGTGVARAVNEVASFGALWSTSYGRVVGAKIVGLAVLAGLGGWNRYRQLPKGQRGLAGFGRTARAELGVGVVVFALAGLLASLVPSTSVAETGGEPVVVEGTDFAETVRVELRVEPGFPGTNTFVVSLDELQEREPVTGVTLLFSSPRVEDSSLSLEAGDGRWRAEGTNVAVPGTFDVAVRVERGADSVEVPLSFHTRCRTDPVEVPGQPTLHDAEIGRGRTTQGYVDPASPGVNEVHFTFFDASGDELPLADDPRIVAIRDGEEAALDVRRFSAGHFLGGGELDAGSWVFEIEASTLEGEDLIACFEEEL